MPHFMIVFILYINLSNLSWIIKCLFLRNMEPLITNGLCLSQHYGTCNMEIRLSYHCTIYMGPLSAQQESCWADNGPVWIKVEK